MVRAVVGRVLVIFKDFTSVLENHYKGCSLTRKTNYAPSTTIYKIYIEDEGRARKDKHYGRNGSLLAERPPSLQQQFCSVHQLQLCREDMAETRWCWNIPFSHEDISHMLSNKVDFYFLYNHFRISPVVCSAIQSYLFFINQINSKCTV